MNLRAHGKRTSAAVGVVTAKTHRSAFALFALGALATFGCHTWQGVKDDTRDAVQETGRGLEKAGKKLEGTGKKQPANPPANKGDAGTPSSHR